ncbi:MAG: SET domain-containing protein-lysine N-methyltransferase [Parcubacteria group bacterium]|nr:SET domain-containing protein-lysine N-methyltransferase [Parcubacteria group bacterium]
MMLVKTKVRPSPIHGLGVFADEFISKGTLVWRFIPGFDLKFTREQIVALPKHLQIYLIKYSYLSRKSKLYCAPIDDNKYMNHSETPNVFSEYRDDEEEVVSYALRDIETGEELTEDYSKFEDINVLGHVLNELVKKYGLEDEVDPRLK